MWKRIFATQSPSTLKSSPLEWRRGRYCTTRSGNTQRNWRTWSGTFGGRATQVSSPDDTSTRYSVEMFHTRNFLQNFFGSEDLYVRRWPKQRETSQWSPIGILMRRRKRRGRMRSLLLDRFRGSFLQRSQRFKGTIYHLARVPVDKKVEVDRSIFGMGSPIWSALEVRGFVQIEYQMWKTPF